MRDDIRRLYADAGAFALALPVLFSIPVVIEFAQHVVEIRLGLYRTGLGGAAAADQRRLVLGFAKTLALLLPAYWFVRYMASHRNAAYAKRIEHPATTLFAVQFLLRALAQWLALFGPPMGILLGLDGRATGYASLIVAIGCSVIGIYFTAWFVAWPLGTVSIGPLRSITVIAGSFWRTVGYVLAGAVPLMLVHYALGYGAIGRSDVIVWLMMTADALVVGFLALTMAGSSYLAAQRAAARSGVALRHDATSQSATHC